MMIIEDAGKFNKKIEIQRETVTEDADGFKRKTWATVISPYAEVKTTRGFTLIANDTDFEKAYTRFTIRYPLTPINRDMTIWFKGKRYTIEYLNDINNEGVLLEIQAKEVTH